MLNLSLMRNWENWIIVFLMVAIPLVALHPFINHVDSDGK